MSSIHPLIRSISDLVKNLEQSGQKEIIKQLMSEQPEYIKTMLWSVLGYIQELYKYSKSCKPAIYTQFMKIKVSFINETWLCNNSIQMGIAKLYFTTFPDQTDVVILNCGDNCIKYHWYIHLDNGKVTIGEEYMPQNSVSMSNMRIGTIYTPKNNITNEIIVSNIKKEMESAVWMQRLENISVLAVITGSIRNWFEKQNRSNKFATNKSIGKILHHDELKQYNIKPWLGTNWFMSRTDEDKMSFNAVINLNEGEQDCKTVGAIGFRNDSSQLSFIISNRKKEYLYILNHPYGIDKLECLIGDEFSIGKTIIKKLEEKNFVMSFVRTLKKYNNPIIGINSEILKLIANNIELQTAILGK